MSVSVYDPIFKKSQVWIEKVQVWLYVVDWSTPLFKDSDLPTKMGRTFNGSREQFGRMPFLSPWITHIGTSRSWTQIRWVEVHCLNGSAVAVILPRAGSVVVRIDPLHFLAKWHKKRLSQVLSVLSLSPDFLWLCVVLLTPRLFLGCVIFILFVCSVAWLFWLGCRYQCKWLTGKTRLLSDL